MKICMDPFRGSVGASAEVGGVIVPARRACTGDWVVDTGGALSYRDNMKIKNVVSKLRGKKEHHNSDTPSPPSLPPTPH